MSDAPAETFESRPEGALLAGGTHFLAVMAGVFVGLFGFVLADIGGALVLGLGAAGLAYAYVYRSNAGTTVSATADALVVESDSGRGSNLRIPFDDIQVVVRKSGFADARLGTGSYELVRSGGTNGVVRYLEAPAEFERLLGDRVREPREQYRDADRGTRGFWWFWPATLDDELPEDPVVTEDELAETLDIDIGDVDLDGLDDAVGMDAIDDFGDVEAAVESSGDAGAFDDSGGAGGGADAGGGGGDI
jgi:hypothetical protein